VEVVVANAGNVTESHVTLTASLTPVAAPAPKQPKSAARVATGRLKAESVSDVIASFVGGGSLDLTLPPLSCRPGGYVLRVSFGTDSKSLRLQVAAA
jgi:hypothetical protein